MYVADERFAAYYDKTRRVRALRSFCTLPSPPIPKNYHKKQLAAAGCFFRSVMFQA
ncbi:hypothetical protein [Planococcus sp. ISL-109]|uniref:hypothetical protein n=1 Tax=Planococcus sp. ISL-109 TaxID=2819166 RepID=UPI0033361B6A